MSDKPRPQDEAFGVASTIRTDPGHGAEGALNQTIPIAARSGPGAVLGRRYEIRAELGRGGEGAVYKAFDRHAEEMVALKILEGVQAGSEDIARLRRELGMARRITHPGIVRLHDLVELDERWALSMQLVEGESLEARLESKVAFTSAYLIALARGLCEALAAAHAAGVTHRDLKPANVLLHKDGRPVISDFGISRAHATPRDPAQTGPTLAAPVKVTRQGVLVGTPLYMAPEQLEGDTSVGPAADVYALGLILYEAATGQVPHLADDLFALRDRRLGEAAPPLLSVRADLPPAFTQVVDRCLARDRAARFADGTALWAALSHAIDPAGRVRPPDSIPRSRPLKRTNVAAWVLGVALLASICALTLSRTRWFAPVADPQGGADAQSAPPPAAEPMPLVLTPSGHRRVTFGDGCEEFPSFMPDGKQVVFDGTIGDRSHLYLLDLASGEQRQLTQSPGWDYAAQVSPAGDRVAFLRFDKEKTGAHVFDLAGGAEPRELAIGSVRPTFALDGKSVWAGERRSPQRTVIDGDAVLETLTVPGGKSVWQLLPLASGELVATFPQHKIDGGGSSIAVLSDAAGQRTWRPIFDEPIEEVIAVAPDGEHVISAREGPNATELIAVPLRGGPAVLLQGASIIPAKGLSISKDRRRVAWSTCRANTGYVPLARDGSNVDRMVTWEDFDAAALPGGRLAVISTRGGSQRPWVLEPGGTAPPRAIDAGVIAAQIAASPDGSQLVIASDAGLTVVDTDGKSPPRPVTRGNHDSAPAFQADGKGVLFVRRDGDRMAIMSIDLAGGEPKAVGPLGNSPVALPGSRDFVFLEESAGTTMPMIWLAEAGRARPLSPALARGRYGRPSISPDGRTLVLARSETEVVFIALGSGRVLDVETKAGDQISRPTYLSDGRVFVARTQWIGDIWVADLPAPP